MRVAFIILLVLVSSIPFSGITQTFGEKEDIPDWVKTTLSLWSEGKITNEEFVSAIEYLSEKGIIEISSANKDEVQRQIDYLKAKSDVFQEEVKKLRDENKELRILSKSQEIAQSNKYPSSMTKMFEEYESLQKEIKSLRETNKQFSKQIDSWITDNGLSDQPTASSANNKQIEKIQSGYVNQINNLKQENKNFKDEITTLKEEITQHKNNIEILKIDNHDKTELISVLKDRNQENRDNVNELMQSEKSYENIIAQIKNENTIQKQKMAEYENKINTLEDIFKIKDSEKIETEKTIKQLESNNTEYSKAIEKLSILKDDQKSELASLTAELAKTNQANDSLYEQIQKYESNIKNLNGESEILKNKISQMGAEKAQYQQRISQLENENTEQRKTLVGIMNDAQESSQVASSLNDRLADFQGIINNLENENSQYKKTIKELENENIEKNTSLISMKNTIDELNDNVTNLNLKIKNYEKIILILEDKNEQSQKEISLVESQKNSENDSLIKSLQKERSDQQKTITSMKIEIEEANNLINTLNSQVTSYEKQIQLAEKQNSEYKDKIVQLEASKNSQQELVNNKIETTSQNQQILKTLTEENAKYQNEIIQLKNERTDLENKANLAEQKNTDNIITISEVQSENAKMRKQIDMLQTEIKQKHEQIDMLKEIKKKEDASPIDIQDIPSVTPMVESDDLVNENNKLLVELNYLKAKTLVSDEEIKTLRGENEEYRILLNLLKKDQKSVTGIENVDYGNIENTEGVVIYKSGDTEKVLPDDWIKKVDNSKKYSIYIEPTPNWSKDLSMQVKESLKFWEDTAGVEFEVESSPSFGIVSIGWKKEMNNEYDGYVVDQKDVTIGLGSSDCDGQWIPYSSDSIKNILIHELGHVVGLDHAVDKSNIMYPMIEDAKFEAVNHQFTIPEGESVFVKGCSFSSDPYYKYYVKVADSKSIDVFFVPSIKEKSKVDSGEPFDYYSDINCIGIDKSSKTGVCKVADSAGMLIINSNNQEPVSVTVSLEEE